MTMQAADLLAHLEQSATAALQEELRFRNNVAGEIVKRERERQFAYRRVEIAKAMVNASGAATSEEAAISLMIAAFRRELGWHGDNEQRALALERWKSVAEVFWKQVSSTSEDAGASTTLREAMIAFEQWYTSKFGANYLELLDHEVPEMPVVEI